MSENGSIDQGAGKAACSLCGEVGGSRLWTIDRKPDYEVDYGIPPERYVRHIRRCSNCDAFFNSHDLLNADFYQGSYNDATYGDRMTSRYEVIRSLPPESSDNKHRANRVSGFLASRGHGREASILDVGVGLCVFLAEMKDLGYRCVAVDPDENQIRHALQRVGVDEGFVGTLDAFQPGRAFEAITFNKVLEHVADPIRQLKLAGNVLADKGIVYVELPDGELALQNGSVFERAEFVLDHLAIYTRKSFEYLATASGFDIVRFESIVEPSGKCTMFGFLAKNSSTDSG